MKVINCGPAASSINVLLLLFQLPFNTTEILRMRQRYETSCPADSLPVSRWNKYAHNRCLAKNTAVNKAACTQRWTSSAAASLHLYVETSLRGEEGEASVDTTATSQPAAAAA